MKPRPQRRQQLRASVGKVEQEMREIVVERAGEWRGGLSKIEVLAFASQLSVLLPERPAGADATP
jgi:hypothetical protein